MRRPARAGATRTRGMASAPMPGTGAAPASRARPDDAFAADVRRGLGGRGAKRLPPRWFYDEVGSALFEAISRLPEYGLTRADERIMNAAAADIALRAGRPPVVIELGSGSGRKTHRLLEALSGHRLVSYHPVDVSEAALADCERGAGAIPDVSVSPHRAEFLVGLRAAASVRRPGDAVLVLFLGSTIGNLERPGAVAFLRRVRRALRRGDSLLVGTDLVKPEPALLAAYDDAAGVTAAFNRNLLVRMNRELGARFEPSRFAHVARWNAAERRIEMHLRAGTSHRVSIPAAGIVAAFEAGETIWTESSVKYQPDELASIAAPAGWSAVASWVDPDWPFSETLLVAS